MHATVAEHVKAARRRVTMRSGMAMMIPRPTLVCPEKTIG
jgi:hypothetical protein